MRLAALIGAGMVQFNAYEGALTYLDQAISIATSTPNAAYPSVAVTAKIDALRGLKRYGEALALSAEAMRVPEREHLKGHQILETRAPIWQDMGNLPQATRDYAQAFQYAKELGYWRGVTESGGPLAQAYEGQNQLTEALSTIDEALNAQQRIPSEMYFAPRNLAIKAEIQKKLGKVASSNNLYERSLHWSIPCSLQRQPQPSWTGFWTTTQASIRGISPRFVLRTTCRPLSLLSNVCMAVWRWKPFRVTNTYCRTSLRLKSKR